MHRQNDGPLWLLSFAIASVLVLLALLVAGFLSLQALLRTPVAEKKKDAPQVIVLLTPPRTKPPTPPAAPQDPSTKPRFTRTSADQASAPPKKADFIGERDTTATSDAPAITGAPEIPSQKGQDQPDRAIETTQSRAQDGKLENDAIAKSASSPTPPAPLTPPSPTPPENVAKTPNEPLEQPKPLPEKNPAASAPLLDGDQLVERPKMPDQPIKPAKPSEPTPPDEPKPETPTAALPKPTPKQDPNEPGFRGNQQKTKLSGSLSRQGRSALDVANTAMGRYQAAISRAVEQEWHRNCTKYRDFITPGILTIRFVIGPEGTVRSINVVEMVDAGEVQKGFTLGAIRQAKIPPLPADLKAELDGDPIELTYNFYF